MSLRVYLSGVFSRPYLLIPGGYEYLSCRRNQRQSFESLEILNRGGGKMKIYLAGEHPVKNGSQSQALVGGGQHLILESYYYARNNQWIEKIIPKLDDFMLDSGAFTAISGNAGNIDWDNYIEEYAEFINRNRVEKFFELDIDSVIGLKGVEKLRRRLEMLTGKQPIPVWHPTRTLDYWKEQMCGEYPYVAIGSTTANKIPRKVHEAAFPWFINTAHEAGCKIHGLGYTDISGLRVFHFDSVDSTAWLYGNRGGYLYRFNETTGLMEQIKKPEGTRLKSTEAAIYNYKEWQKFQLYALKYL